MAALADQAERVVSAATAVQLFCHRVRPSFDSISYLRPVVGKVAMAAVGVMVVEGGTAARLVVAVVSAEAATARAPVDREAVALLAKMGLWADRAS